VVAAVITSVGLAVAVYLSSRSGAALGGAIVGGGIACMHYLGMSAVELPGHITWDWTLVIVSVVVGMLFGMAALALSVSRHDIPATTVAATLLTLAIVSHHFIAMGAVEIVPDPSRVVNSFSLSPISLALAVAATALAVLVLTFSSAFVDSRLRNQND